MAIRVQLPDVDSATSLTQELFGPFGAELVQLLAERNRQLEQALRSRIMIEQAKGVLAERLMLEPNQAFEILRRAARSQRRRIHALANEVVVTRETPPAIRAAASALHVNGDWTRADEVQ